MRSIPNTHYIRKEKNKYRIIKKIHGKRYSFGTYNNIYEAIIQRDMLMKKGWPMKKENHRHIKKRVLGNNEIRYDVRKNINGVIEHFGTYKNLNDAIKVRNQLERSNWDWDIACECTNETKNQQTIWLNKQIYN